jgi:hypothetical protein
MTINNLSVSTGVSSGNTELAHIPVGTMMMYAGGSIPNGWLECNGQSTSGYTALAALVGATVPNINTRFVRGQENATSSSSPGNNNTFNSGGATFGYYANTSTTGNAWSSHYHGTGNTGENHQHNWGNTHGDGNPSNAARGGNNVINSSGQSHNHSTAVGGATGNVYAWHSHGNVNFGGGTHEHTQSHTHTMGLNYLSFRCIIKY